MNEVLCLKKEEDFHCCCTGCERVAAPLWAGSLPDIRSGSVGKTVLGGSGLGCGGMRFVVVVHMHKGSS